MYALMYSSHLVKGVLKLSSEFSGVKVQDYKVV